jgi:superfamily II DNA or RNA helicase
MVYHLREYQVKDIEKIRSEYRAGAKSVLHVSPTGSGKL